MCLVQSSNAHRVRQAKDVSVGKGRAGGELDAQKSDGGGWRHHGTCMNFSCIPHSSSDALRAAKHSWDKEYETELVFQAARVEAWGISDGLRAMSPLLARGDTAPSI